MTKAIQVRIKSNTTPGLYLEGIDAILGVSIAHVGQNPPWFKLREAAKMVNYLNELESLDGYVKHEWKIVKA